MVGYRIKSLIDTAIMVLADCFLPAGGRITTFRPLNGEHVAALEKMQSLDMIKFTRFEIDDATVYRIIGKPDPAEFTKCKWIVEGF